jgi:hypothetical protein
VVDAVAKVRTSGQMIDNLQTKVRRLHLTAAEMNSGNEV